MKPFKAVAILTLLSVAAAGQTFIAADVHPSPHSTNPNRYMTGGVLRAGRYDLRNATMVELISTAWGIDAEKVLSGPNWLELDRFDIVAKAPPSTSPETLRMMLQALLADRFQLVIHKEDRPMPVYMLSLGKGKPKLKEAAAGAVAGCQSVPPASDPAAVPVNQMACRGMTMEGLAQTLRDNGFGYISSPVVDSTGLKGAWDFDLRWTSRTVLSRAGAEGITLYDAVDKQLGLKLELKTAPTSVIVVDSANEKPSDNPPGITSSLPPPPPAEFEVADIKPSMPDTPANGNILPGGRLDLKGFDLRLLIRVAWNINTDDMILGGPKFIDGDRFDVIAKASSTTSGPANSPQMDDDDVRMMLRALLIDRFKLAVHTEDRPLDAYTLLAAKPKLTKADPINRTGCKEGPPPAAKDPRDAQPVLARLVTCRNMTMAQFAAMLPTLANGYVHSEVKDETALEGAWDFTVNFSPIGVLLAAAQPVSGSAADPSASDPGGALSLPDALNRQLGLKLELRKRPVPVLVIDHVEPKPTEN
jgi:uncharacterized protein (TIGR03435 family)